MANEASRNTYVVQDRGNRATPNRCHPRYTALKLLFDRLTGIVESDALKPGQTVLDYGCGNRPYEQLFKQKFRQYIAADFPGNVQAEVQVGPHGKLPLESGCVDCVLSTQVLEHVEDPRFYLGEAHRVLTSEGSLILSTHGTWPYHPDPTDFWRWTVDGLRREINSAGFDIWQTQSVLGLTTCSVQLWQDATLEKVPRLMRTSYIRLLQSIITWIERRNTSRISSDACIYVVFAKKRLQGHTADVDEEARRLELATREATACIPGEAKVILVDQDELGSACLPGRAVVPFIERNGRYNGPPIDERQALRELDRLHQAGAEYIVFAWPAFWWLDYYPALIRRLRWKAKCVLDNDRLVVFALGNRYKGTSDLAR